MELIEKLVSVNRISKASKGGRRFSFSALVVVGDGKGRVGYGSAKAKEVPDAVRKASKKAEGSMVRVSLKENRTLHHDVQSKFCSGKVIIRSAPSGTGIIAGGAMRAVFESLGVQDVVAKSMGSSNPYNMIKATIDALQSAMSPKHVAAKRGLRVQEIIMRRATVGANKAQLEKREEKIADVADDVGETTREVSATN